MLCKFIENIEIIQLLFQMVNFVLNVVCGYFTINGRSPPSWQRQDGQQNKHDKERLTKCQTFSVDTGPRHNAHYCTYSYCGIVTFLINIFLYIFFHFVGFLNFEFKCQYIELEKCEVSLLRPFYNKTSLL